MIGRFCVQAAVQTRRHVLGDEQTLPDHFALSMILALITANIDLSTPILYTAALTTDYGEDICEDVFELFGTYYAISQLNIPQPIICGWLSDYWGRRSHTVMLVCGIVLAVAQASTLWVSNVWLLGAIFLTRTLFINQCLDQALKALSTRTNKVYEGDEDKKEDETQRTGAMSDFWTSVIELSVFGLVYYLPDPYSRYVLVGCGAATTLAISLICLTYTMDDFDYNEEESIEDDGATEFTPLKSTTAGSSADEALPVADRRTCVSKLRKFWDYVKQIKYFAVTPTICLPLIHYGLIQLFNVVVTFPLSQDQAEGFPVEEEGECDGLMKAIYVQNIFAQLLYLPFSLLYVSYIAKMPPFIFYRWGCVVLSVFMIGVSSIFYVDGIDLVVSAIALSVMQTLSYFMIEYDTWFLMAEVREDLYGYSQVVMGVEIALVASGSSLFMIFSTSTAVLLLLAQFVGGGAVLVGILVSFWLRGRYLRRLAGEGDSTEDGNDGGFKQVKDLNNDNQSRSYIDDGADVHSASLVHVRPVYGSSAMVALHRTTGAHRSQDGRSHHAPDAHTDGRYGSVEMSVGPSDVP